jgi:hypothetical protein
MKKKSTSLSLRRETLVLLERPGAIAGGNTSQNGTCPIVSCYEACIPPLSSAC